MTNWTFLALYKQLQPHLNARANKDLWNAEINDIDFSGTAVNHFSLSASICILLMGSVFSWFFISKQQQATSSFSLYLTERCMMSTSNFAIHNNSLKANPSVRSSSRRTLAANGNRIHAHRIKAQSSSTHSAHRIHTIFWATPPTESGQQTHRAGCELNSIFIVTWRCRFNNNSNSAQHK